METPNLSLKARDCALFLQPSVGKGEGENVGNRLIGDLPRGKSHPVDYRPKKIKKGSPCRYRPCTRK